MVDNEVYTTESVDYNSVITPPSPPERSGYSFSWSSHPTRMPAYDITIYGNYTTGIDNKAFEEPYKKVFSIDGKPRDRLQKGVNIIQMSDRKTKKLIVK